MALSNDNQDYGKSDKQNKQNNNLPASEENKLTSDDFKGKKVDADLDNEQEKPAEQKPK